MIKQYLKSTFLKYGYDIRRIDNHREFSITKSDNVPTVDRSLVNSIFNFIEEVPPFYGPNIRPELKISGAWNTDFLDRRKTQIRLFETVDKTAYSLLLNQMLQNELVYGIYGSAYFNQNIIGSKAPPQFIHNLEKFTYLTGLSSDSLPDGDFGGRWGVDVNGNIITLVDPYKGINAFNTAKILSYLCNGSKATYIDLGSGIGSDAIKVMRFCDIPVRAILIDLPLNLTTAFSYVSMNTDRKCVLISNSSQLREVLSNNTDESEFLFIPTIFIEELMETDIVVNLLYNHGSFSEMDYDTVRFYLQNILNGTTQALYEINSNSPVENNGGHIEVPSARFPIPYQYKLVKRNLALNSYFDHRYVENLYVKSGS
tara:strand:- start:425 stop:1534 length:1110 start_codon:yes stop_codon:yes gene_type:complete